MAARTKSGISRAAGSRGQKSVSEESPVIEYPREGEVITYPHYTAKIRTGFSCKVEVSIDGGDWQDCRFEDGYWWFDWKVYSTADHSITARVIGDNGKILGRPAVRKCRSEIG
jgi:hypothetical protein